MTAAAEGAVMKTLSTIAVLLLAATFPARGQGADWLTFRGPGGASVVPAAFDERKQPRERSPIAFASGGEQRGRVV